MSPVTRLPHLTVAVAGPFYSTVLRIRIRNRIRIHRNHMFLGLLDSISGSISHIYPDSDPAPDLSIINLDSYCFVTSF
jgi:hypothetical protein